MNEKQRRFAAEYLVDRNATQAAVRAGYSEKTAGTQGDRLLRNVAIAAAVAKAEDARAERVAITADMVLAELGRIGFSDEERAGDRVRALDLIGKHLGMFPTQVSGTIEHKHAVLTDQPMEMGDDAWRGMFGPNGKHANGGSPGSPSQGRKPH